MKLVLALFVSLCPLLAHAEGQTPDHTLAIVLFVVFVAITLGITYWAKNAPAVQPIFIPQVEGLPVFKMAWRLPVTICPPHPFSV